MKFSPLLILLLCFSALSTTAQKKIIAGTIRDEHSEEPVPFASILFKGSPIGQFTDVAGNFSFHLDSWPSDTLEITCVGYQPCYL